MIINYMREPEKCICENHAIVITHWIVEKLRSMLNIMKATHMKLIYIKTIF